MEDGRRRTIALAFEKLSRFDRIAEPCSVAVPFPQGDLADPAGVAVCDGDAPVPTQCRVTATWPDGSVKWLLVHFLADLPGNAGKAFRLRTGGPAPPDPPDAPMAAVVNDVCTVRTGPFALTLGAPGEPPIRRIKSEHLTLETAEIVGPRVRDGEGRTFDAAVDAPGWRIIEAGPVRAVAEAKGRHIGDDGAAFLDFTLRVHVYAGKPWARLDYRIVNRESPDEVVLAGMHLTLNPAGAQPGRVRTALATSNYRTTIRRSDTGEERRFRIDAEHLVYEGNEQVPETLYGTFWADWTDPDRGGLCVTVHQAYQNFPKELAVGGDGLTVSLVPEGVVREGSGDLSERSPEPLPEAPIRLIRGMARTHRLLLHMHGPDRPLEDLDVRTLQFQMPDRPTVAPEVYERAGVLPDAKGAPLPPRVERRLIDLADRRTRGYGMLNWGDGPDAGYTEQGRGRGDLVWTNNEYDLPRAALVMYARTGERRFLDYALVAAEHWMDVDVCHHSDYPLRHQGQIVHSARHATEVVTISHEWVEGLLDYWHQTGDDFALQTALGIGENVLRHLDRPHMRTAAASQARETGWALRALVALFEETHDDRWMEPAAAIVDQFEAWQREYGAWLAPYTSHSLVRVPFMIAVAVNSLMCYHRVRPEARVAEMVEAAMRDLIAHSLMPDGRFYYKELPSLHRRGANTLVLQALAHAYDLTGDAAFLEAGLPAFELALTHTEGGGYTGSKFVAGDAVVWPQGSGPKAFAANAPPILAFARAAAAAGLLAE